MLLSNMHPSEQKSVFQMVYHTNKEGSKKNLRPTYFSITRVMKFKEMQLLCVVSTLEQIACYMSLDIDNTWTDADTTELSFYFYGASLGLAVLGLVTDCVIKQHMLFFPILGMLMIQLVFYLVILVYGTLIVNLQMPNDIIIGLEGFFESQA